MRPQLLAFFLVAALAPLACAENSAPPKTVVAPGIAARVQPPEPLPSSTLRRSEVRAAVKAGVGAFLQHLELDVEQPVFAGGKFHGFRVQALHDPTFWRGVDLRAGDVVTRVNGFAVERPEDAQQALDSLEVASELRVLLERNGQTRELRFSIVDDEPPAARPGR